MSVYFPPALEARRLNGLPLQKQRAQFGDRVARTFLLADKTDPAYRQMFAGQLRYNAELVTELRRVGARLWE